MKDDKMKCITSKSDQPVCADVTDGYYINRIVKFDLILYDNFITYNTCLKQLKLDEKIIKKLFYVTHNPEFVSFLKRQDHKSSFLLCLTSKEAVVFVVDWLKEQAHQHIPVILKILEKMYSI